MTDPKPYTVEEVLNPLGVTPEEAELLDAQGPANSFDADRVLATVQALADAQTALDLVMQHGAERVPHPIGDLARVEMPWPAWEQVLKLWEQGGGNDRLHALLGIDDEEASDGTAERRQALATAAQDAWDALGNITPDQLETLTRQRDRYEEQLRAGMRHVAALVGPPPAPSAIRADPVKGYARDWLDRVRAANGWTP